MFGEYQLGRNATCESELESCVGRNEKDLSRSREERVVGKAKNQGTRREFARRLGGLKRPPRAEKRAAEAFPQGFSRQTRWRLWTVFVLHYKVQVMRVL